MSRIAALALMLAVAADASSAEPPKEFTNSIGMKFKLIPAGEFMMGSPESDSSAYRHRKPQHKVRITKPFYLGMYEVTQAEYEKVMGKNPSAFSKGGKHAKNVSGKDTSGYPVEQVSWDDAVEFCKRLSAQEGKNYRLPTEAEWEYACRAGTTTKWSFSDKRFAWYDEPRLLGSTHPVGAKEANAWGLFDMHGNVCEWCQDRYGEYDSDEAIDPTGPPQGSGRVRRGGCWANNAGGCLSSFRRGTFPSQRAVTLGFRVARVPSASPDKSSK